MPNEQPSLFPSEWDVLFHALCQEMLLIHYQGGEMEQGEKKKEYDG